MKMVVVATVLALASPCAKPGMTESEAQAKRLACAYKSGALPADSLAADAPHGSAIPIDHIVIVMQENHAFDNYYSMIPGAQVATTQTNPDSDGTPVARFHQPHMCVADVAHDWDSVHQQYDNGKNDGFVVTNNPDGARAMGYWDAADLPFYYGLSQAFAIGDHHHCDMLSETAPNRMYGLAATSFGIIDGNSVPPQDPPALNIMNRLNDGNVTWAFYSGSTHSSASQFVQTFIANLDHMKSYEDFLSDAQAGALPNVMWVEPGPGPDGMGQDEHPANDIQTGEAWVATVVNALMASPNWPKSALFITYDEHGGFYDSVPPPMACPPDDIPPMLDAGMVQAQFNQFGFRVPMIAVSPYAKRGYISHTVTDATSMLRFIEARFNLPAMTARDANADPLFDLFDFSHADTSVPSLPEAVVDQTEFQYCLTTFPP